MGNRAHRAGEIANLIALAYQSALTPAPFEALLPELARAVDADTGFIALWAAELGSGELAVSYATPNPLIRAYREHFWKVDLWRLAHEEKNVPVGRAVSGAMLVPYRDLLRSEMYNDAMRAYDLHDTCCGRLFARGHAGAAVSLLRARPKPLYGKREIARLDAVLPHMSRAFALHRRCAGLIAQRTALSAALDRVAGGALLCDRDGRVVHATARAHAILDEGDALFLERGRLGARDPAAKRALAAVFERGATPEALFASRATIAARRGNGAAPLRLTVVPARFDRLLLADERVACYVLIDDPADAPRTAVERVAHHARLTPAETRLLRRIVAGETVAQAAQALAISVNTAHYQLKQILHKTGTHRQMDLLRLCLGLALKRGAGA